MVITLNSISMVISIENYGHKNSQGVVLNFLLFSLHIRPVTLQWLPSSHYAFLLNIHNLVGKNMWMLLLQQKTHVMEANHFNLISMGYK